MVSNLDPNPAKMDYYYIFKLEPKNQIAPIARQSPFPKDFLLSIADYEVEG